jgi:hypothetical protein
VTSAVLGAALVVAILAAPSGARGAVLAGTRTCEVAPSDSVWRTPVASLPVAPNSAAMIAAIGASAPLHPDFGSGLWDGGPIGIPYTVVAHSQRKVHVSFLYPAESDRVGYPIPRHPQIEGGPRSSGDRHVLLVDRTTCTDYELWDARPVAHSVNWTAGSGAVFNLRSDALRPATWTSADAAGLAILPGLVRPEDVARGVIDHAIRVTVPATDARFIWPARHEAGVSDPSLPPMGLRLRLKASVSIAGYPRVDQIILQALKTYGMIVADNGSPWYLSGVPSPRWNNDQLHVLDRIVGSDFEVVNESCLEVAANSARADLSRCAKGAAARTPEHPRRGAPRTLLVTASLRAGAPTTRTRQVAAL